MYRCEHGTVVIATLAGVWLWQYVTAQLIAGIVFGTMGTIVASYFIVLGFSVNLFKKICSTIFTQYCQPKLDNLMKGNLPMFPTKINGLDIQKEAQRMMETLF